MANTVKTGFSPDSVKSMVFGAGVLYKNFTYGTHYTPTFDTVPNAGKEYYYISGGSGGSGYTKFTGDEFVAGTKYFEKYEGYGGDKIGATKEGTKVSIIPDQKDIEVDGVLVKMKGLIQKTGEKATMEAIVLELNSVNISCAVNGVVNYTGGSSIVGGTAPYVSTKSRINEGDYVTNLAIAARRLEDNKLTVVVFKNAICTSGMEIATKNKEVSGSKMVFEAVADQSDQNTDTLPVEILVESVQ